MPCKMYSCCIVNWPIAMYCAAVNSAYNMPCTPENFQNDLLFGFSLLLRNFNILLINFHKIKFYFFVLVSPILLLSPGATCPHRPRLSTPLMSVVYTHVAYTCLHAQTQGAHPMGGE